MGGEVECWRMGVMGRYKKRKALRPSSRRLGASGPLTSAGPGWRERLEQEREPEQASWRPVSEPRGLWWREPALQELSGRQPSFPRLSERRQEPEQGWSQLQGLGSRRSGRGSPGR
jgi:hypothetical protein